MLKKIMLCGIMCLNLIANSQTGGEIFVNRVFQDLSGNPQFNPILNQFGVQWSKSITAPTGELITVGHTNVSGQGENIYLIKHDPDGNVIFQTSYNSSGSQNDYGTSVALDISGNIYVCGTTDNGGSTNYDVVLLQYNSGGTLLNNVIYSGTSGMNDVATDLAINSAGFVFVSVANENPTTGYDYLLLKFNTGLTYQASGTYNFANLNDIPSGIEINGNDVFVSGASANSLIDWDYATAKFDATTCNFGTDSRSSISGVGFDQPLSFKKDANGNMYITGKATTGSGNLDILTVKISPSFVVLWSVTYNGYGLDDVGSSLELDASGNVIVGGLSTKTNNKTEMVCIKYNGSTGSLMWTHKQSAENVSGDAFIKAISINSTTGNIYFAGGENGNSGVKQVIVGRINSNGTKVWEKKIKNLNNNITPSDIEYGTDGVYVISVLDSINKKYITSKYTELELDTARTYSGGVASWKTRELIVSFLPSSMNKAAIDNKVGTKESEYGNLNDYLTSSAYTAVNNALSDLCRGECNIQAVKVYDALKTTDTIATSRLGENVPIPSFWTTLLLQFPASINIQQAQPALKTLPNVVSFAHPNYFISPTSTPPNDSLYASDQPNLHYTNNAPLANINIEEAWDVVQDCGASFIKGGVFDTGINWKHKDFGYTGSFTSGKVQGWHFSTNFPNATAGGINMRNSQFNFPTDPSGHGTAVAGIIGAIRNNTSGVSGIAGGNATNNNSGVSLYSLNTGYTTIFYGLKAQFETSRTGTFSPYNYGLNFSNHSYGLTLGFPAYTPDSVAALTENVHFANRMQIAYIVSRGNSGNNNYSLPACLDPEWVISVGGTGSSGQWKGAVVEDGAWLPSYGRGVDVAAPCVTSIVKTTWNNGSYINFNGTSAAAPHVSGVVGLLMSYMNDSTPQYKNLAPEDCEFIITRSATDVGVPGIDSLTGYGRLNAGKALRMVEKPIRVLYHYGTNYRFPYSITKSVYSNSDTIILTEKYQNYSIPSIVFPARRYVVKTFQIDATVSQIYSYPTDSLMYYWPRHSGSFVYPLPNAQKKLNMHERLQITSQNGNSANLRGYVYQVWDTVGNFKGWWPCDTTFSALYTGNNAPKTLMEYSVLSKNKAVGINEINREARNVSLFPNPADKQQTLIFESDKESNCTVDLYDLMGRFIKTVYKGKINVGKTSLNNNVEGLPNSMYIYIIKLDDKTLSKKFIKQ